MNFAKTASPLGNTSSTTSSPGPLVLLQKNLTMKQILAMIFFPVAIPYIVYKFVSAFRKRYGLKSRALEGKVSGEYMVKEVIS